MRILYSAGNRWGAGIQLYRFLQHNRHEIKIAAYEKSSQWIRFIDWTLDSLYNKYSPIYNQHSKINLPEAVNTYLPKLCKKELDILILEIKHYNPDLVICDDEPIVSAIAKMFKYKLWYCSPICLLGGTTYFPDESKYKYSIIKDIRNNYGESDSDKTLMYSPFYNVKSDVVIKGGYEFVKPYTAFSSAPIRPEQQFKRIAILNKDRPELHNIMKCIYPFDIKIVDGSIPHDINILEGCEWLFTYGETSYLADAIYNNVNKMCIAPTMDDTEMKTNSVICEQLGIGHDVGQVEKMRYFAVEAIEESLTKTTDTTLININKNIKTLDELIDEEENKS